MGMARQVIHYVSIKYLVCEEYTGRWKILKEVLS